MHAVFTHLKPSSDPADPALAQQDGMASALRRHAWVVVAVRLEAAGPGSLAVYMVTDLCLSVALGCPAAANTSGARLAPGIGIVLGSTERLEAG